jgi:hypothetical protein
MIWRGLSMKLGAVVSALAFGAMLGASPVSASVVDLHTLPDGNTFWGNGHSNSSLSHSSTTTDTYLFRLSSPTGASSLTVIDGFLGFSGVTLELFSGFGPSATEIDSVTFPSLHGSDPLVLSESDLKNGRYELKVIDILPPATEAKIEHHWHTFPSTGGYLLDFDVHNASPLDPPPSATSAVPEPSTWAMMMLGFCGLAFLAHRRRGAARALPRPA